MEIIYHLILASDWEAAKATGEVKPGSLAEEGFIHCSRDDAQALAVAKRLYAGQSVMVLLEVDTEKLLAPVKREASRSGEIYPHIYGPLNADAVVGVRPLELDVDGEFRLGARHVPLRSRRRPGSPV